MVQQQHAAVPQRRLVRCSFGEMRVDLGAALARQTATAAARSAARAARRTMGLGHRDRIMPRHASIVPSLTMTASPPIVARGELPAADVQPSRSGSAGPSRSPARSRSDARRRRMPDAASTPAKAAAAEPVAGSSAMPMPARTCGHGNDGRRRRSRGRRERPPRGRRRRRPRRTRRQSGRARAIASSPRTGTKVNGLPADQRAGANSSKPISAGFRPSAAASSAASAGPPLLGSRGMSNAARPPLPAGARTVQRTGPTLSSSTMSRRRAPPSSSASSTAVPTVGWPANGSSRAGVKMRSRARCSGSSGGNTNTVSGRLNSRAIVCIAAVSRPSGLQHHRERIAGKALGR